MSFNERSVDLAFSYPYRVARRASFFLAIALFFYLFSCGGGAGRKTPPRVSQAEVISIVEEITNEYPGMLEPITKDHVPSEKTSFRLSLYVDQSQSIRGYIPPVGGAPFYDGSNFISLLHALGHQGELNRLTNAKSFGSGLPQSAEAVTLPRVVDLMNPDPKDYNLLNNDYASQIEEILRNGEKDEISLILTDGVQSYESAAGGSLMGATARSLKKWIAQGGYVETLLSTAPFKGKYFSEELRAIGRNYTLNVEFRERPFVVFVLIPSEALLDEWDEFKKRDRLKNIEFVSYRLPQTVETATMPTAAPGALIFSKEESVRVGLQPRTNEPYARLDPVLHEPPWGKNLHTALIHRRELNDTTGKPIPSVPVAVEITAPKDWEGDFDSAALAAFRPILRVFERSGAKDAVPAGSINTDDPPKRGNIMDRAGKANGQPDEAADDMPKNWELVRTFDLRVEDSVTENLIPASGDSPQKLRLCYMLPWTGKRDLICTLEMNAPTVSVEPPRFDTYSTTDDSTPEQLNRIYNLATLMGQLAKDENKTDLKTGCLLLIRNAE